MIIGMMRVKNEARWIERVLASMLPVCERVYVFDDHSTDGTPFICSSLPRVSVFDSPFSGLDESRDKNYLLEKVMGARPEFILHVDGDEELAPGAAEAIRAITENPNGADAWRFRILYLWDREDQIRVDGIYGHFAMGRLFRPTGNGVRFQSTQHGGNFHCGNVPDSKRAVPCDAKILHYGYLHSVDRVRKYEWYNKRDPNNRLEDRYRHVAQGDLANLPATAQFRHAGPLKLEPLSNHL